MKKKLLAIFTIFIAEIIVAEEKQKTDLNKCYDMVKDLPIIQTIRKGEAGNKANIVNWYACQIRQNGKIISSRPVPHGRVSGGGSQQCKGNEEYRLDSNQFRQSPAPDITTLSVRQIIEYQSKGTIFAVGLHQFEPNTFKSMAQSMNAYNEIFTQEFQEKLYGHYWFKMESRGKTAWNYLTCSGDIEVAALNLGKIWALPVKAGTPRITASGKPTGKISNGCETIYDNGVDKSYSGLCYDDVLGLLKQSKNQMINENCANCQKEDVNETAPENSAKNFDYTHTDKTFQSSKRQLKAQYKYERANNCYCN